MAVLLTAVSAGADRSCIFADTRFTPEPVTHVVHLHRLGVGCTVATVTALHHGQVVELVKKKCAAAAILGLRRGREGNKRFLLVGGRLRQWPDSQLGGRQASSLQTCTNRRPQSSCAWRRASWRP